MKKILFLLSTILLFSCETEFEINADWQELMVVHGILDQSQEETPLIKFHHYKQLHHL